MMHLQPPQAPENAAGSVWEKTAREACVCWWNAGCSAWRQAALLAEGAGHEMAQEGSEGSRLSLALQGSTSSCLPGRCVRLCAPTPPVSLWTLPLDELLPGVMKGKGVDLFPKDADVSL